MAERGQSTLVVVDGGLLVGQHQQQVLLLSLQGLELVSEIDVDVRVGRHRDSKPLDLLVLGGQRDPEIVQPREVKWLTVQALLSQP